MGKALRPSATRKQVTMAVWMSYRPIARTSTQVTATAGTTFGENCT
jgi:hypothetical protein